MTFVFPRDDFLLCYHQRRGYRQVDDGPVVRGETFRRKLAKQTDEDLESFLWAAKRLAKVFEPLPSLPIDLELDTESDGEDQEGERNG